MTLRKRERRLETSPLNYQFGEFTLDIVRGCVLKAGQEIKLRPKVYETLKYLVEHPGRLIGKQELIQAVWADAFVTDDSLVQCTVELRRALDDRAQHLLKTVPRRGYVFSANVVRCPPNAEPAAAPDYFDSPQDQIKAALKVQRRRQDLPVPRTSFVGREHQIAEATELLLRQNLRLLTMTGPGGSGKTRLAVAVAAAVEETFVGGIQFVGLSSITDPGLVTAALAKAFELQPTTNRSVSELIQEKFQNSGPFLLVLDNFEQVLPAAKVVADILESCPSLKVSGHQPGMPSDLWGTRISGDAPCARIGRRALCSAGRCGLARLCDDSRDCAGNSRNLLALRWIAVGDRARSSTNQSTFTHRNS